MSYMAFYIDRLPFTPKENQVIYFNPSSIAFKMTFDTFRFIDQNYSHIKDMFKAAGLDFCFLPAISRELKVDELLSYFHPEVEDVSSLRFGYDNYYCCFLDCLVDSGRYFSREVSGLIRYSGFKMDNKYIFNFTPICTDGDLRGSSLAQLNKGVLSQIENYILANRVDPLLNGDDAMMEGNEVCGGVEALSGPKNKVNELRREGGVYDYVINKMYSPETKLSTLLIKNNNIYLPEYNSMEIKLGPLAKTVFFFYLKHPEGVRFKELADYRDELREIYGRLTCYDDRERIEQSVDHLTDPLNNSINENCSRIRYAFLNKLEDNIARNYYITGTKGEVRRIVLPREMVSWE